VKRRMQIIKLVGLKADSYYDDAQQLAEAVKEAVGEMGKSQLEKLRANADCALKVSDVLNYIKNQAARNEKWRENNFADQLLEKVNKKLKKDMKELCSQLTSPSASDLEEQQIHLMLIREYINQFVTHCFYTSSGVKSSGAK
jgi:CRISPR/Cas system CSM-associated protein Csm4 (group 5 of RAMP superfamily)